MIKTWQFNTSWDENTFADISDFFQWSLNSIENCLQNTWIKKEYIIDNKFPDLDKSEEKDFLKSYKNPLEQMDPFKAILVIAHDDNTVDKYQFMKYGKKTNLTLDDFKLTNVDKYFYLKLGKKK